MIQVS
jgi:hypothetical protein